MPLQPGYKTGKKKHTHTLELVVAFPKGGEAMLADSHFVLKATLDKVQGPKA